MRPTTNTYIKIAVVVPTCDKERKPFLNFLLKRIKNQTRRADHVFIIDHPNKGGIDITDRFKLGMDKAFDAGCDFIICMEDDDYYPLTYIGNMERAWLQNDKPQIIGHFQTINYNIRDNTYRVVNRSDRASAYCTAVGRNVNFDIREQIWDVAAWMKNDGVLVNIQPSPVGIKHGTGMTGGHTQSICTLKDTDKSILRKIVDKEAFEFYEKIRRDKCAYSGV